ncbi:MAG: hypothetical protein IKW66_04635 [Clostridia bacterium]|nr:hypothetical protein [Clostridia bacterium]MBR5797770.1 hypothetical protein [Clostridia bacterium]
MTNNNYFLQPIRNMHPVPYYILKLGFALIALFGAIMYIVIDITLPDYVYAHYIFLSGTEYITVSIVLLVIGCAWLHRLFGPYKKSSGL